MGDYFPSTRKALELHSFKYIGDGTCRHCGMTISWYETPRRKKMPMSAKVGTKDDEEPTLDVHFDVCCSEKKRK